MIPRMQSLCPQAMFSDSFLEQSAPCVTFPGVDSQSFRALLHYLYTDRRPRVTPTTAMGVIELANRMVLHRLVTLVEESVIQQLAARVEQGQDVCEEAISLLQPSQIHNAEQLSEWCLAYLSQSYSTVCRRSHAAH